MRKILTRLQESGAGLSASAHYRAVMQKVGPASRALDPEEYPPIAGMEGPFSFRSGKVLYYDPKEGAYYDRKQDVYLPKSEDPNRG